MLVDDYEECSVIVTGKVAKKPVMAESEDAS